MLDQKLADHFIKLKKIKAEDSIYDLRSNKLLIPLIGQSSPQEEFILDIHKSSIRIEKHTFQNRVRKSIGLIRIDFGPVAHTNPDGQIVKGPHIHIYKEGYDLKWAYLLPYVGPFGSFKDSGSLFSNLEQVYKICNIVEPPQIQGVLL